MTDRTNEQLFEALSSTDYLIYSRADEELEAWFAKHPTEAVTRATELVELALRSSSKEGRQKVGYLALPIIAASLVPSQPLPEAYDVLVSGYGTPDRLRSVLLAIPEARRLRIFESQLPDPTATHRLVEAFLDLAPGFATPFLRAGFARTERDFTVYLTAWERLPSVAKQLAAHREWMKRQPRKPPPPPPPPEPKGTLSFAEGRAVLPEDYDSLDAVGKAQYRVAAGAYVGGGEVKNPKDFVKKLIANDLDESDAAMRRWKVLQDGVHRYDFWVVWVDNGSLFEANGKKLPVHQIQGSFQALEKKPKWIALADDLRRSEPSSLWTVPKPTHSTSKKAPKKALAKSKKTPSRRR